MDLEDMSQSEFKYEMPSKCKDNIFLPFWHNSSFTCLCLLRPRLAQFQGSGFSFGNTNFSPKFINNFLWRDSMVHGGLLSPKWKAR